MYIQGLLKHNKNSMFFTKLKPVMKLELICVESSREEFLSNVPEVDSIADRKKLKKQFLWLSFPPSTLTILTIYYIAYLILIEFYDIVRQYLDLYLICFFFFFLNWNGITSEISTITEDNRILLQLLSYQSYYFIAELKEMMTLR